MLSKSTMVASFTNMLTLRCAKIIQNNFGFVSYYQENLNLALRANLHFAFVSFTHFQMQLKGECIYIAQENHKAHQNIVQDYLIAWFNLQISS